jgi:hypothetical protein
MLCATTRPHAASLRRRHEIARALEPRSGRFFLAHRRHLRRIADVRQVGELMDDDLRFRRDHRGALIAAFERIRTTGTPPDRLIERSLPADRVGAGDGVAGITQEPEQRLTDHTGRTGDEKYHARESATAVTPPRRGPARCRSTRIFDSLAVGKPPCRPWASRPTLPVLL